MSTQVEEKIIEGNGEEKVVEKKSKKKKPSKVGTGFFEFVKRFLALS